MNPGPIDLTPFGGMLRGAFSFLGLLYWGLFAYLLWRAVRKAGITHRQRAARAGWVLLLFGTLPAISLWQDWQWYRRSQDAESHFQERCKTAGEFIHRKVAGVDGVMWMRWRHLFTGSGEAYQFALYDPYGMECSDENCIDEMLRVSNSAELNRSVLLSTEILLEHGLSFVEAANPADGKLRRYTKVGEPEYSTNNPRLDASGQLLPFRYRIKLSTVPIDKPTARYGVTWEDLSTRQDRERWIAGGALKIIDLQTGEVIAERRGFMRDTGLGSRAGFRDPWAYATRRACPPFPIGRSGHTNPFDGRTIKFVRNVLKVGEPQ